VALYLCSHCVPSFCPQGQTLKLSKNTIELVAAHVKSREVATQLSQNLPLVVGFQSAVCYIMDRE